MSKKVKKDGHQKALDKLILVTTTVNLLNSVIELISKILE